MNQTVFRDFVKLQRGFDLPRQNRQDGSVPVIGATQIQGFHNQSKVSAPGVTTGRSGALGDVMYLTQDFWPLNTSLWVKDFKGNEPRYVYYKLKTLNLKRFNSGAGVPTLNRNHLDTLPVEIHSQDEQQKIAGVLGAYDDLIENNSNRIDKLESMARLLYRHYFENTKFESKQLHEVAKINPEGISRSNQPKTISYIDISSVGSGVIQNRQKLDYSNAPSRARRIVKDGDLIWATVRPNRKQFAYIHRPLQDTVVSTGFVVLRPTKLPASYLYYFLSDDRSVAYLVNHATGSAYPAVNASVFEDMPIPIPPSDLLQKYDYFVSSALKQIKTLYKRNEVLAQARDLLLPRIMSGEVKV